jgi:hypothetical protein
VRPPNPHVCKQCGAKLTKLGVDINHINEEISVFKERYPEIDVEDQLERFVGYLHSKGRRFKNYIMAFHNWCKNAVDWSPGKPVPKKDKVEGEDTLGGYSLEEIAEGAYYGK